MATIAQLAAKVAQFLTASDKAHAIINGANNATVEVDSGVLPTFAKAIKDIQDEFDAYLEGLPTGTANNYAATVPPSVNDDSSQEYAVGSAWFDTVGKEGYRCVDASVGAAIWIESTFDGVEVQAMIDASVASGNYSSIQRLAYDPLDADQDGVTVSGTLGYDGTPHTTPRFLAGSLTYYQTVFLDGQDWSIGYDGMGEWSMEVYFSGGSPSGYWTLASVDVAGSYAPGGLATGTATVALATQPKTTGDFCVVDDGIRPPALWVNDGDDTTPAWREVGGIGSLTGTIAQFNSALTDGNFATLAGAETLTNKTLTNPTEGVVAIGNSGTSQTLALTNGTFQTVTLTGNCTFTMPTATAGKSFILKILTGAGSYTAAFTGVKWSGGTAPTITATASKYDIVSFVADGTAWSGSIIQNFTA